MSPRAQAEQLAKLWAELGFAVWWTDAKEGDGAKQCKSSWNTKAQLISGMEFENAAGMIAQRLTRKNPVLVAKASNLILVDCDSPEDVALFKSFGPPPTLSVATSQGRHFYYRPDEGDAPGGIYFEAGSITPKSDCYLVMPPAIHPSGRVYAYENENVINVLPKAVRAKMLAAAGVEQRAVDERMEDDGEEKVPESQRHAWLARKVGAMANIAISEEWLVEQALMLNATRCDPPKPEPEVRRLAKDFWKRRKSKVDMAFLEEDESRRDVSPPKPSARPKLDLLDDGLATMTRWFPGYDKIVPVGYHVGLVAPGGTGKGLFLVLLSRSMSKEHPLLYSGSEDNRDMLKRRLAASGVPAGAFIRFRVPVDGDHDRQLRFPSDVELLEETIVETGAAVFAYDAGPAHMDEGLDPNSTTDVRSVVDRLSEVAERTGCTIVCVLHPNKSSDMVARDRASGSKAWIDAMRHALFMVFDDEEDNVRHIEAVKTNIGETGYGWEMVVNEAMVDQLDADGKQIQVAEPHVEHVGRSKKSVDIILSRDSKQKAVMKWALAWLEESSSKECESDTFEAMILEEIDCKARTVRRGLDSLKKRKKIKSIRRGGLGEDGQWFIVLCLPGEEDADLLSPPLDGLDGV